ncbi:hypothetical protein RQP54_18885 [Curvibacter sp. APW13]|uniref:hypothetical protein n=1 Tax=Curvibacter sp. APW13 TaxID=3077236 RepID=UPI0028DEA736|nr:hypothetical protein [Curvibacter sp. APW13]MDT8992948.1 hypothetical protein [Curvibacter sp. APW13]
MKYTKTDAGQLAFKQRSPQISARQRSMFILFDGNKTAEQVLAATAGMGGCQADIDALVENGFLALLPGSDKAAKSAGSAPAAPADASPAEEASAASGRSDQERYLEGMKVATQITSALGLRGFRLNLSVEAAGNVKDLLELLPKIEAAAGAEACKPLRAALKG